MTQDSKRVKEETIAQQKERLRQQCDAYRAGIGRSRKVVRAHLGADEIAKIAIGLVSARAQAALSNFPGLFGLKSVAVAQRVLPLVLTVSLLRKRSMWSSLFRRATLAGLGATAVYFVTRKKKKADHEHVALHERL